MSRVWLPRYLAAWALASGVVYRDVPTIPYWGEGLMRVLGVLMIGALAVVLVFLLGLPLRMRWLGRDWNRGAWLAVPAILIAVAAHFWSRESAEWIAGVRVDRSGIGEGIRLTFRLGGWLVAVFLVVNFPRRSRIGFGFGQTFSPGKRRFVWRGAAAAGLVVAVWWFIPAPLSGYWHTPMSDCLCDSKNLLVFEDGKVFLWASAHGLAREPRGTYRRHLWWVTWDKVEVTREGEERERVELRPGWFFMKLRSDDERFLGGRDWTGWRETRPDYIREVLATRPSPLVGASALVSSEAPSPDDE